MLTVDGLVKRFGGFTAVNNVSFRVEQGEILGLIGPERLGQEHDLQHAVGHADAYGRIDRVRRRGDRGAGAAPHHQQRYRPHLPDPAAVSPAQHVRERGARRLLRPGPPQPRQGGRGRRTRARHGRAFDRPARQRRWSRRRRPEKARTGKGARHRAKASARRRKPRRARRARDGSGRRHAAQDPRRTRHHHHLGRAHHGRADAGGRPRHGARSRREDFGRPAERGGRRSQGDRGLSRHGCGFRARLRPRKRAARRGSSACSN